MTFTEPAFVVLLAATYLSWLACGQRYRARLAVLLVASVVFYGYDQWRLLPLLGAYCVVAWAVGRWIARSRRPGWVLALGVAFNLAGLCYWKYTPLLLRTAAGLGLPSSPADGWQIPFGISFFAFTGIAYMADVYRGVTKPETNFARFALYKTFFPQLVAGPILRPGDFLDRLRPGALPARPEAPLEAALLVARGLFKKMVLADRIALAIDPYFAHVGDATTAGVWALPYVWLYALQIYFDFSGYTDVARGLGLWFGFRWPENFRLPYLAGSVQEFWHRWHITLSQFLKDYLYVPLGGSRCGPWRTHLNLMATMLLGGLWHGASWTFVLWGGLHGAFLVAGRLWSATRVRNYLAGLGGVPGVLWRGACVAATFHAVCLAWVFFRLSALPDSFACLRKWFVFDAEKLFVGGSADVSLWLLLGLYGPLALLGHRLEKWAAERPEGAPYLGPMGHGFRWGVCVALLLLAVLLSPGGEKPPFIYFQF